jgi:hypothetical protein
MNTTLLAAGVMTLLVGLIHSVLGEVLIFRRMRTSSVVPTACAPVLLERHVRILWASWHLVTILGFLVAALLLRVAFQEDIQTLVPFIKASVTAAMLASAALVAFATKGKHPGWLGLLAVTVLTWQS